MSAHSFLFSPGVWLGQGHIILAPSQERLQFYTRWVIEPKKEGVICCQQRVEMPAVAEQVQNSFYLHDVSEENFTILLVNEQLGQVHGRGLVTDKSIAWEFRINSGLEGFEIYHLQENGGYLIHAEYASLDQFKTVIDGFIWKKVADHPPEPGADVT